MGKALYRKYRSKSLDDVVGQDHIIKTLKNALSQGHISHAYLFTGPHGVGKTSVARILAHEINKLPYVDDMSDIDIIEIDAASNRRIDEIRELRDKVYVAPVQAKYKVYIIDEVHMLTREAFNALLKTLEEPPSHVIFILATTESHKLPQTIVSRTQRFTFKPADVSHLESLLTGISKNEKITISKEAIKLIAEHASGSYRDAVSLLDQASSISKTVSGDDVLQLLGVPPDKEIAGLLALLNNPTEPNEVLKALDSLYRQGFQASTIAKQLSKSLRDGLAENRHIMPMEPLLNLLADLVEVPASYNPEQKLEIYMLQAIPKSESSPVQAKVETLDQEEPAVADEPEWTQDEPTEFIQEQALELTPAPTEQIAPSESSSPDLWQQLLSDMKSQYNTLYGIVRMAKPEFTTNDSLILTFNFEFHKKRLEEKKNRKILEELLQKHAGRKILITLELEKTKNNHPGSTTPPPSIEKNNDSLITISNIFGGGELLES